MSAGDGNEARSLPIASTNGTVLVVAFTTIVDPDVVVVDVLIRVVVVE